MWVGPLVEALALGSDVSVFLINTEGATDPVLYERLVGARPEDVTARVLSKT